MADTCWLLNGADRFSEGIQCQTVTGWGCYYEQVHVSLGSRVTVEALRWDADTCRYFEASYKDESCHGDLSFPTWYPFVWRKLQRTSSCLKDNVVVRLFVSVFRNTSWSLFMLIGFQLIIYLGFHIIIAVRLSPQIYVWLEWSYVWEIGKLQVSHEDVGVWFTGM